MFRRTTLMLSASALSMLAACAEAPQQNIDAAKSALEAARGAQAEEYAPKAWQLAEDAHNAATAEVEAQNQKFALLRSYDTATELLNKAREQANAATTEANEEREQAKARAEAAITEAETAISEAQTALESAPKGKGTEADLKAMADELTAMTTSLAGAREAFSGGRFQMAQARAESVRDGARAIVADIAQATAKKSKRA